MATTALIGSTTDSLLGRAPGTVDTVDIMDAALGISMTADTATLGVVNSAATLDVAVTEERVFAANAGSAVKVASGEANPMGAASAANRTTEASAAKGVLEAGNLTAAVISVAEAAPMAEAARVVEDAGKSSTH